MEYTKRIDILPTKLSAKPLETEVVEFMSPAVALKFQANHKTTQKRH